VSWRVGDPRLIKALSHPMRTRILGLLDERIASPRELSEELGVPLQNVSYHVRELAKLRLVKLVRTRQRRGAFEHLYTAVEEVWSDLPPLVRHRLTAAGLSDIFHQVNEAAAHGGFVADDAHLSRTQLVLDDVGREALTKELEATIARVERIHEQSRERLGDDHIAEQSMALVIVRFDNVAVPTHGQTTKRTRRRPTTRARPRPRTS
jgi:DNA-binding transcriptional ArsR family regulator